jgi:hypothetical protein
MKVHPVSFGFIPNLAITYRVSEGIVETMGMFGSSKGSVPIRGASFSFQRGGWLDFGVGDVIITGRNQEKLVWQNVPGAELVVAQLRRLTLPATEPVVRQLSKDAVIVPTMPYDLSFPLLSMTGTLYGGTIASPNIGDVVEMGQPLYDFGKIALVSPESGKVIYIGRYGKTTAYGDDGCWTLQTLSNFVASIDKKFIDALGQDEKENRVMAVIQPFEGQSPQINLRYVFQQYFSKIEGFAYGAKPWPKRIEKQLHSSRLMNCKEHMEILESGQVAHLKNVLSAA